MINYFGNIHNEYYSVSPEVALICKAYLAMVTLIRFLFGVSSDVIFEAMTKRKTLQAILALVLFLFSMSSYMHFQGIKFYEPFLTVFTLISIW